MSDSDLLLPAGSRLLHIGPPKTGTTTVQEALRAARAAMSAHGVIYPGDGRHHSMAARAVLGTQPPKGHPPTDPKAWGRLVREVSSARHHRVIVSSEMFSGADDATVRTVIRDLGGTAVHVVITLRPLIKILPSTWQQRVRIDDTVVPYEDWLTRMLCERPDDAGMRSVWRRHQHGLLVERWASVVGVANMTVVVPDESDRQMLLRVFASLLGLPSNMLQAGPLTNPSLSFGEVELVRLLNQEFHDRGWSAERHLALVRQGLVPQLLKSNARARTNRPIRTPPWAAEIAAGIGRAAAEKISASGVRVVGDLGSLCAGGASPDADGIAGVGADGGLTSAELDAARHAMLPSKVASRAVLGTILAASRGTPAADAPKEHSVSAHSSNKRPDARKGKAVRTRKRAAGQARKGTGGKPRRRLTSPAG